MGASPAWVYVPGSTGSLTIAQVRSHPMKKFSLTHAILVGGLLAAGGIAQAATTSDVPLEAGEASTMTGGAPNLLTNNIDGSHTAVLGAGPAVVYTTEVVTYGVPVYHLPPPVAL